MMDSATHLQRKPYHKSKADIHKHPSNPEKDVLRVFLLGYLHKLFGELFQANIKQDPNYLSMECYAMDNKIIQQLIQGIIDTGEYTLEGIARYTQIPLDIILDAACGRANEFSITPWARIVDIYTQVKPEITQILIDKLILMKNNRGSLSLLLSK